MAARGRQRRLRLAGRAGRDRRPASRRAARGCGRGWTSAPRPPAATVWAVTTIKWHRRSRDAVAERYGASKSRAKAACPTASSRCGSAAPARRCSGWPGHRALVCGDALLGDGRGGLRMCPDSWLGYLDGDVAHGGASRGPAPAARPRCRARPRLALGPGPARRRRSDPQGDRADAGRLRHRYRDRGRQDRGRLGDRPDAGRGRRRGRRVQAGGQRTRRARPGASLRTTSCCGWRPSRRSPTTRSPPTATARPSRPTSAPSWRARRSTPPACAMRSPRRPTAPTPWSVRASAASSSRSPSATWSATSPATWVCRS